MTEELKNRAGGGDEIKKINRPISLGKEGFPRKENVEKLVFMGENLYKKINYVFI